MAVKRVFRSNCIVFSLVNFVKRPRRIKLYCRISGGGIPHVFFYDKKTGEYLHFSYIGDLAEVHILVAWVKVLWYRGAVRGGGRSTRW